MYRNVLVAVEPGDDAARQILDRARELVGSDAERHVIFVLDYQDLSLFVDPVYTGNAAEKWRERLLASARRVLAELCQPFRIDSAHQLVTLGDPADEIRNAAEELRCDLIVIGTHGVRGWRRLLGSTANQLLHGNKLDVYVVKINPSD